MYCYHIIRYWSCLLKRWKLHEPHLPVILKRFMGDKQMTRDEKFIQMWIRMVGSFIYIFYSCIFILYFVLLTVIKRDNDWAIHCENVWQKKSYIFIYLQIPILLIFLFIGRVDEAQTMRNQIYSLMKYTLYIIIYTYLLGLYLFSYLICLFSISFWNSKVLESIPSFSHRVQSHLYLNIYLTRNSFFGCQIGKSVFTASLQYM